MRAAAPRRWRWCCIRTRCMAGTMNNKVVYTLYQTFVRRGFSTLRFNFRGVGRSQGSFDRGEGELADAAAALDWLQSYNPNAASCWVAGYSFGAWIGMQLLMRRPEIEAFISVSPPANQYDFTLSRAVPVLGADPAGRPGHAGPDRGGAEAGAQAVAPARHQDRFPQDPRRRPFLRRLRRNIGGPCRRLYRGAYAIRRAGGNGNSVRARPLARNRGLVEALGRHSRGSRGPRLTARRLPRTPSRTCVG